MQVHFGPCTIELVQGDITQQAVDAVVNAANARLAGGGGVDGAIHRAAGPQLMQETREKYPDGCSPGSAVATGAGKLNARYVFHTVGPVWGGGNRGEADVLRSAYHTCLQLALDHECDSIAFPAVSTGVYAYPVDQAAEISLTTARDFLTEHGRPRLVRFVLFDAGTYGAFSRLLEAMVDS